LFLFLFPFFGFFYFSLGPFALFLFVFLHLDLLPGRLLMLIRKDRIEKLIIPLLTPDQGMVLLLHYLLLRCTQGLIQSGPFKFDFCAIDIQRKDLIEIT